jgi:hypothetical protein
MRPEDHIVSDIKGILHVSGRVVFGQIQSLKVVIIKFNLRAFLNAKAHGNKDILYL